MRKVKENPADGVQGMIISCFEPTDETTDDGIPIVNTSKKVFRIYHKDEDGKHKGFTDYEILHHDLSVVVTDKFASFKTYDDGRNVIDYSERIINPTKEQRAEDKRRTQFLKEESRRKKDY